ncbi:MAG: hypothetical protein ACRC8G_09265 [Plesiomonas shigelloides]
MKDHYFLHKFVFIRKIKRVNKVTVTCYDGEKVEKKSVGTTGETILGMLNAKLANYEASLEGNKRMFAHTGYDSDYRYVQRNEESIRRIQQVIERETAKAAENVA